MNSSLEGGRRGEAGATIVLIALALTALLSVLALAIDIGMLFTVKSEAQRTADAAAMAGAGALINNFDDDETARDEAERFGEMNAVQGVIEIDPEEDVDVDLVDYTVTVRAHRDEVRGGPVDTWFARIFGVDLVNIGADATAKVEPAGAATCVVPFSISDRYHSGDGDDTFDPGVDFYDPHVTGYGTSWRNPGEEGDDGLGFINDFGREIVVKGNEGTGDGCCPGTGPSWYYLWRMPGSQGGNDIRENIASCNPAIIAVGEEYRTEPGNKGGGGGPVPQGVADLIAMDPGAEWGGDSIVDSDFQPWVSSPRIRIVPTFDPSRLNHPSNKKLEFTNFIAVFFEGFSGNGNDLQVHGRILFATGIGGGTPTAPGAKFVQLIE